MNVKNVGVFCAGQRLSTKPGKDRLASRLWPIANEGRDNRAFCVGS